MEKIKSITLTIRHSKTITPDLIVLDLHDSNLCKDTQQAIKLSDENFKKLSKELENLDFKKKDLKTISFNVYEKREYVDKKEKSLGIQYNHDMKLELFKDENRLGQVLELIQNNFKHLAFEINYEISDMQLVQNEILTEAIKLAIEKAQVLSKAGNIQCGQIISINNQQDYLNSARQESRNFQLMKSSTLSFDQMTPEDKEVFETIVVEFEIL